MRLVVANGAELGEISICLGCLCRGDLVVEWGENQWSEKYAEILNRASEHRFRYYSEILVERAAIIRAN